MGAATACFLARDHGAQVTVVERDTAFTTASSALSASSIRQQFSTPANIALSAWSLGFLRRADAELGVDGQGIGLGLVEPGYLYLATAEGAATLRELNALQRAHGADIALLEPDALAERFPWLAVGDLALGSLGLRGEGWFDGPALHQAFRRRGAAAGVRTHRATALRFEAQGSRVTAVTCDDGIRLTADAFVLCAGGWSAPLAATLGVALPVAQRKRDVFVLDSPAALPGWANAWTACGFSGHGMQHAPAVGCALAAALAGAACDAPSIAVLDPARIAKGQPLRERNVI